jgi:hypothetical protein
MPTGLQRGLSRSRTILQLNQGTPLSCSRSAGAKGWIKGTWQTTENNREAKTRSPRSGTRALADQAAWWRAPADLVNRLLTSEGE